MVNNYTNINHHSLKHKKGVQHHLMLEMQVMVWDRINDGVTTPNYWQGLIENLYH
jgi:hypothetical protein